MIGDGQMFTILTTDDDDQIAKVRIYDQNFDMIAIARNVVDGSGSIMRNIGVVNAFATNGNYIAVSQERIKNKPQVTTLFIFILSHK